MPAQVEAPIAGLQWLQGTISELRAQVEELRKTTVGLRMRCASLEEGARQREKDNEDLKAQLQEAESQLDSSSADMRAAVKEDVLSDIELLGSRDRALATVLVLLSAKVMQSGAESMQRLGLPPDVISVVRGLVYGGVTANVPAVPFTDGANGIRYTPPPSVPEPPPHNGNRMSYTRMSAEEHDNTMRRLELEAQERPVVPRRVVG